MPWPASQRCCAAKAQSNQCCDGPEFGFREMNCRLQISNIGGEVGARKVAFASTQTSHVVTQHGDPVLGEPACDADNRLEILIAGKAMAEHGDGEGRQLIGPIDNAGELETVASRETHSIGRTCHAVVVQF